MSSTHSRSGDYFFDLLGGDLTLLASPERLAGRIDELLEAGHPADALVLARHLAGMAAPEVADPRGADPAIAVARAALELGLLGEAEEALRVAQARAGDCPGRRREVALTGAELHLTRGQYAEATREVDLAEGQPAEASGSGAEVRLRLVRAALLRLLGDLPAAREQLALARERLAPTARAAAGRVGIETVQLDWAAGDLTAAAGRLAGLLAELDREAVLHLLGEALLLAGRFVGEQERAGGAPAPPGAPLGQPAAHYLARALECFMAAGALPDLERVRQHFRLYGRRASDHVIEARLSQKSDEAHRLIGQVGRRVDRLWPEAAQALGGLPAVAALAPEARASLLQGLATWAAGATGELKALFRVVEQLVGTAHTVAAEREHLRAVLSGVERLGALEDGDQLARTVTELSQEVVEADCVVLALVTRTGDLQLREARGLAPGDALAWRFLAEQARRTERPAAEPVGAEVAGGLPVAPDDDLARAAAVPIRRGGRLHGVLYADRKQRGGVLTREAVRLLQSVASLAGTLLESQRMNSALRVAARTREATMEAISDGVLTVSSEGQVRQVNSAVARLLGVAKAEAEGRLLRDLPGFLGETLDPAAPAALDGRVVRLPEGDAVVGARVIRDDLGQPTGTVITLTPVRRVQRSVDRLLVGKARYTFGDILGEAPSFRAALDLATAAARADVGVLITGESGTGKEVVAQAIHNASARAAGPFVGINCAAIPRDLLESELFGYEEGAFTGARRGGQPGKFEVVDGGTVLLDEIGDMPLEMQAKLLRVLQERRFQRVGGSREHVLDARVMATTNRDLEELARTGRFRADLLYRLKVIHVHLPPLRERQDDISRFAELFMRRTAGRLGRPIQRISAEVLEAFRQYPWPGNVRELEYVVESEVNLAAEGTTELTRVPASLVQAQRRRDTLVGVNLPSPLGDDVRPEPSIEEAERELLIRALRKHRGNVPAVARALGVSRGTVYNKLRRYELHLDPFRS